MSGLTVVSALMPDARGTGKALMWSGLWRHLALRYPKDGVTYVLVRDRAPTASEGAAWAAGIEVPFRTVWIRSPAAIEQAANLVTAVLRGRPFQEAALGGLRVGRALRHAVRASQPAAVLVDTYRLGVHLSGIDPRGTTRLLYMEDLFSVRYERMLDALRARRDLRMEPLGNFGATLPGWVRRIVSKPRPARALLASEARRVRRTEREAPIAFDRTLLLSPDEVALLASWTGSAQIRAVPPKVDLPSLPLERRPDPDSPKFIFLGAMNLPHNDVGLTAFLVEAMPALLKAVPRASVEVVGSGVSSSLRAAAAPFGERVRFSGFVEDLDAVLATATALIVPLLFGSGIKIKVLEAVARGLPVVATPFGTEGLVRDPDGADGLHVAESWPEFVARAAALADRRANEVASVQARQHFVRHYAPDVVARVYDALL